MLNCFSENQILSLLSHTTLLHMLQILQYHATRILKVDSDHENWQPHTPATLSLGKEHRYTLTGSLGGLWRWSECFGEEKIFVFYVFYNYILFLYISHILFLSLQKLLQSEQYARKN
jgi:hypothetical protein